MTPSILTADPSRGESRPTQRFAEVASLTGLRPSPRRGGGKPVREALGIVRPPAGGRGTIPTQVADFEPPFLEENYI